jgi:pyruvate kinase
MDQSKPINIKQYKRTKIIATLGPATNSYEMIENLIQAGANGIRLNFSHGTYSERDQQISWIRYASEKLNKPVAIIQDLQGPKIRLGDFDGIFNVKTGQKLAFYFHQSQKPDNIESLPVQYDLSLKVKIGERIMLYDGKIRTTVKEIKDHTVYVEVENDGILIKRKGINLPDTDLNGDILTAKDLEDITYGAHQDIDYVALSFVQSENDILLLREKLSHLKSSAKIIAKIETPAAVKNIEKIMQVTDAAMVARGDLAIETPAESVPIIQREIIGLGIQYNKPTIVATQMLASMTDAPDPTRAEVSDIATAVLVGADCVMLSDETATGKYPIESIQTMKRVINYTEKHTPLNVIFKKQANQTITSAIGNAIITLANQLQVQAIIAETKTGTTALSISSYRPIIPLLAITNEAKIANQLAIVYATKVYVRPATLQVGTKLTDWLIEQKILNRGDIVINVSGSKLGVAGATDTIKIRTL